MKIPASAMNEITKAVMAMLPYEEARVPGSSEAKMVQQIFDMLSRYIMHESEELSGFIQFITKSIDESEEKQDTTRKLILELLKELNDYEV